MRGGLFSIMPQEQTALVTDNVVNNSGSGFLPALGDFVKGLVGPATDIYKLQLQGDILKNQYASQTAASDAAAKAAAAQQVAANSGNLQSEQTKKLWLYGGLALVAALVLGVLLRRGGK